MERRTPQSSVFRETADDSSPYRGAYKEYPPPASREPPLGKGANKEKELLK